jgi:parallel beta-helix repeat protein
MKGMFKNYRYYFKLFLIIILFTVISGCNGVTPFSYTITATAGAGGSINPSGVIGVSEGSNQTFTITPEEGYQISEILVDGISVGTVSTYTFFNVEQDHTIQANFVLNTDAYRVYNIDTEVGYDTIQEAIDKATSGQSLIVYPGTYYENIIFDDKNITVRSSEPLNPAIVASTIIDGGSGSVVEFTGGDTSTLEGFTIRDGDVEYGGGINVYTSSSPTINGNTITGNTAIIGGGIYLSSNSNSIITNNTITSNTANYGGGIYISKSNPTIQDNTITDNEVSSKGGGIYVDSCHPTITTISGNTITDNMATESSASGGGIYLYHSSPIINNNNIVDNVATNYGGGIYVTNDSSPIISDNDITDNAVRGSGGGIFVSLDSELLPVNIRPTGWGAGRENIPYDNPLVPAEGLDYTIAGNTFTGNEHGDPLDYTEGAHVYFE